MVIARLDLETSFSSGPGRLVSGPINIAAMLSRHSSNEHSSTELPRERESKPGLLPPLTLSSSSLLTLQLLRDDRYDV